MKTAIEKRVEKRLQVAAEAENEWLRLFKAARHDADAGTNTIAEFVADNSKDFEKEIDKLLGMRSSTGGE